MNSTQNIFTSFCHYCERFELLDMLNDALLLVDANTYMILYMNEKARQMYGYYTGEEIEKMHMREISCDMNTTVKRFDAARKHRRDGWICSCWQRKKNGDMFKVQVSLKYIKIHGTDVLAAIVRDVTADMRLKEDIIQAGRIQQSFLQQDMDNDLFTMKTVFKPYHHISGDFYGYIWHEERSVLFGYLIDVMGHGVSAALQAASSRALFDRIAYKDIPLNEKLLKLNNMTKPYFAEDSLAAVICFELDFKEHTITCASGGINYFLALQKNETRLQQAIINIPGMLLGVSPDVSADVSYEQKMIPFQSGDSFFFLSDGLLDLLRETREDRMFDFENLYGKLGQLAESKKLCDDASAMCFLIK